MSRLASGSNSNPSMGRREAIQLVASGLAGALLPTLFSRKAEAFLQAVSPASPAPSQIIPPASALLTLPDSLQAGHWSRHVFESPANAPDIEITINLPEFMLRFFVNGVQVDSAPIACGMGGRRTTSPVVEVKLNQIEYRQPFNPTDDELRDKHPLKPTPPEKSNSPAKPRCPTGRRLMVLSGAYRLHGTHWPESMGHTASSGCIRVINEAFERITDLIVLLLSGYPAQDLPSWHHTYVFSKSFTVRSYYSLWSDAQVADSRLLIRAWPDIHHHLDCHRCTSPIDENVRGNGYTQAHFLSMLGEVGVSLKPGFTAQSPAVDAFWQDSKRMLQNNRKKGDWLSIKLPPSVFNIPRSDRIHEQYPNPD